MTGPAQQPADDPQVSAVRAAGDLLDEASQLPLAEQVAVFSEVHSRLQSALADVESTGG